MVTIRKRQLEQVLETRDVAVETRNFWKWLALVSWICAGVAGALAIFPIR